MNEVNFFYNWNNKLNNHLFTTIRSWNSEKEKNYRSLVGEDVEILLNGKLVKIATLKAVLVEGINYLPTLLLQLDTGIYQKTATDKLFNNFGIKKNSKVIVLFFESKTNVEVKQ